MDMDSSGSSCGSTSLDAISSPSFADTSSSDTDGSVRSLLDVLKGPASSDLARKRRIATNPPMGAKRRTSQAKGRSEPTSVTPKERVREFKDEPLTVSCGRLFCSACREPMSLKKSVLKLHIESIKHKSSKVKLQKKEERQRDIVQALKKYDNDNRPKGETLSDKATST